MLCFRRGSALQQTTNSWGQEAASPEDTFLYGSAKHFFFHSETLSKVGFSFKHANLQWDYLSYSYK